MHGAGPGVEADQSQVSRRDYMPLPSPSAVACIESCVNGAVVLINSIMHSAFAIMCEHFSKAVQLAETRWGELVMSGVSL